MMRHALKRLLRRINEESPVTGQPVYNHPRISRENPFFSRLISKPGCNHNYAWGVLQAAVLAKSLDHSRISVIEFGVAGGNGLVALEKISEVVSAHYAVHIDVHGFDTGIGLPPSTDYRDLPDICSQGDFPMHVGELRNRLRCAQLHLGLAHEALTDFILSTPSPVGFLSFDMDLYSSTMQAFRILEADEHLLLPRIHCFFDDIFACGDFNGERLAISEFNDSHRMRKISKIYGLEYFTPDGMVGCSPMLWDKYYMAYIFDHRLYGKNLIGPRNMDLIQKRQ